MYFQKCELIKIDGVEYIVSNAAQVDFYSCKTNLFELWNLIKDVQDWDVDRYTAQRKELVLKLKEFDKRYLAHIKKKITDEMGLIHSQSMKPLDDCLAANVNYYNLR